MKSNPILQKKNLLALSSLLLHSLSFQEIDSIINEQVRRRAKINIEHVRPSGKYMCPMFCSWCSMVQKKRKKKRGNIKKELLFYSFFLVCPVQLTMNMQRVFFARSFSSRRCSKPKNDQCAQPSHLDDEGYVPLAVH